MKVTITNVGNCLTQRELANINEEVVKYSLFAQASQFDPDMIVRFSHTYSLHTGYITYGVTEDKSFVWLGEIIDSGD